MDGSGRIKLKWADGEHDFRLGLKELRELQDKTNCGPEELLKRISAGTWRVDDLRETLRIGLIGGGLDPMKALTLTTRYVDNRPFMESKTPAYAVLLAALAQPDEDRLKKVRRRSKKTPTAESPSPSSSDRPSPSE